jgi:hypothetical protein
LSVLLRLEAAPLIVLHRSCERGRLNVRSGQTLKSVAATGGSAFPSGADIIGQVGHVRKVPKADSCSATKEHYSITSSAMYRTDLSDSIINKLYFIVCRVARDHPPIVPC